MQLPWTFRFTITVEEYTNKMGQTSLNVMIENSFFIDVYLWDNIIYENLRIESLIEFHDLFQR